MAQLRYFTAFLTFLFMIAACSEKKDNSQAIFDQFNHTLINSNLAIDKSTELIAVSLNEKLADPVTADSAKFWYPRAEQVRLYSKGVIDRIDEMLQSLEKEENENSSNILFSTETKRTLLGKTMQVYTESVRAIDQQMSAAFVDYWRDSLSLNRNSPDILSGSLSVKAAIAVLNNFKNQVLFLENRMIQFCLNQVPGRGIYCDFYSVFAVINSTCVSPGEKIEVIVGVGNFSTRANPVLSVNAKPINVGADGVLHYIFKAKSTPGKHYVPLKISYTDEEGKEQIVQKIIEYTVANIIPQESR